MLDGLARLAARHGDKLALVMSDGGRRLSFAELDQRATRIAAALRGSGLRDRDTIALLLANDLNVVEWWWGARRAGLYYAPIGTHLLPHEIAHILADSKARLLIASPDFAELPDAATTGLECRPLITDSRELAELLRAPDNDAQAAQVIGREMMYSSGTTGKPKGIRRELAPIGDEVMPPLERRMRAIFGYDENTIYLSASPLYHATGRFLNRVIEAGGTVVILPRFDAEQALAAIERHRVTHSQWVPAMFRRMLDLPDEVRARYDLSSMKAALHASAPCPLSVKRAMIAWWGPVIHEYYGGTENAGVTYITATEWLSHPGSVGRSIAGPIHILDEQDPTIELPAGAIGLITFEGGVPFRYTLPDGGERDNASPQGYTGYGDIGHVDAEGYLYISDRRDDLIISGGVNLYPREIEAALETHPGVREVAVIGLSDASFGQRVCAVIVPTEASPTGLAESILDHARANLSRLKVPREVILVDELPHNETGKVLKRVLRERYGATEQQRGNVSGR